MSSHGRATRLHFRRFANTLVIVTTCHDRLNNVFCSVQRIVPDDCREVIFEGAQVTDSSAYINVHHDRVNVLARQQLKPVQNATHNARWKAIKERFAAQTTQIIEGFYEGQSTATVIPQGAPKSKKSRRLRKENPPGTTSRETNEVDGSINPSITDAELQHKKVEGMFTGKAGLAKNWRMHFTSLVNGTGYQHPHADAGFPDSYKVSKYSLSSHYMVLA